MSRALNVNATRVDVLAMCGKHNARISVIEDLLSGGTRVVLANADDAAIVGKAFGAKIIKGAIRRTPLRGI